jgi:hypothetical protein
MKTIFNIKMSSSRCAADTSFLSFTIGMRQKVILAKQETTRQQQQHSALQHSAKQNLAERHSIMLSSVGLNVMAPSMFQQRKILKNIIFASVQLIRVILDLPLGCKKSHFSKNRTRTSQ